MNVHPSDCSDDVLQVFNDLLQPLNFFLSGKDAQDFAKSQIKLLLSLMLPVLPSYFGILQLHVCSFKHAVLVYLHLLGQVVYVGELLAQLQVLQRQIGHLCGDVLLLLLQALDLLLQSPVGLLQILQL